MSLTPPRYTPADFEEMAEQFGICTCKGMLRQGAQQARVLDRLRETLQGALDEGAVDKIAAEWVLAVVSRLLREEGVTPT